MSVPNKSSFQMSGNSSYPLDNSRTAVTFPNAEGGLPSNYPPVFIVQAPRLKRTYDSYEITFVKILAFVQGFCGLLSIILGIASPLECGELGFVGYGIWSGVMYMVAGMIQWMSAEKRTTFLIVTTTVLSIINSCLAVIQFCLGTYSADQDVKSPGTCPMHVATYPGKIDWKGTVVIDSLLACTGLVEAAAAIFSSIACCVVICGPQDYTTASDIPIRRNRVLPAQFVFTSNQPPTSYGNSTYITGTSR